MHQTREMSRHTPRRCGGCGAQQSAEKLIEIEALPDDGLWNCERCGREHSIV